jgi:DNA-binding NtrC family response regulator
VEAGHRFIEARQKTFDPFDSKERRVLLEEASKFFEGSGPADGISAGLKRVLRLCPEGVPEAFVLLHTDGQARTIREHATEHGVVIREGRWRLEPVEAPVKDELHEEIASLFSDDDPRRLVHLAFAGIDKGELVNWARERISELEEEKIIELGGYLATEEVGSEILEIYATACIAGHQLGRARAALHLLSPKKKRIFESWVQALDQDPSSPLELPGAAEIGNNPRACAEIALRLLKNAQCNDPDGAERYREFIAACLPHLSGNEKRLLELEAAALREPELLNDRAWRQSVVSHHEKLVRRHIHLRGSQLINAGALRPAERLLRLLLPDEGRPAWKGLIEIDLANICGHFKRRNEATAHSIRGYRYLQVAGFQNRIRNLVHNLAVDDLDVLEVDRADARFSEADPGGNDDFVAIERVRLALARGDLRSFRAALFGLPMHVPGKDVRVDEAVYFLKGVGALLEGDTRRAEEALLHGGSEGKTWLPLVHAMRGESCDELEDDGWGVGLAAELIAGRPLESVHRRRDPYPLRNAFAIALADRIADSMPGLTHEIRTEVVSRLERGDLGGWASSLRGEKKVKVNPNAGLLELVESGSPERWTEEQISDLLTGLGVSGLEILDHRTGERYWRIGDGEPAQSIHRGRFELVPLGCEAQNYDLLALVGSILELAVPMHLGAVELDTQGTGLLGDSPAMQKVRNEIRLFAQSRVAVAFLGETGVGKGVAAKALHRLSGRKGSFVAVNVAAIPSALLEAELFGSVKGAYTGADRSRTGLATTADGGTLFLDEIGDLDSKLQAKLLRFAELQTVRPVGSDRERQVDVRIVTATHRDLEQKIADGSFRQDLYYRVASVKIPIPPLRERVEDVDLLRDLFTQRSASEHKLQPGRWSQDAGQLLRAYSWPGNVRELLRVVEVALIRSGGGVVTPEHVPLPVADSVGRMLIEPWDVALDRFRRKLISDALAQAAGNRTAAARLLGISRQTLNYHMRNLGID